MTNLRIVGTNDADSAVLSSGDFLGGLPVGNLQIEGRARVARTANSTGYKNINGNWAAAKIVSAVVLYGCNFSSAASIRVRLWDGENQAGSIVYDSNEISALYSLGWGQFRWGIDGWGSTVFKGWASAFCVHWLPHAVAARSFQITFRDESNPAAYLQIKRLLIGAYFEPLVNVEYGIELGWSEDSTQTRTLGSTLPTDRRGQWRVMSGNLGGLNSGERAVFFEMTRELGLSREFFISVFPEQGGATERDYSMLGKFDQLPRIGLPSYNCFSGAFSMVEV